MKKIYILHGWAYSIEKWKPFLENVKKDKLEPVMLEIPGLTAPLEEVWNIQNYVDWLKKILEKEDKKIFLLGHSNGGRIALAFTAQYPEKIERLILIDSAGIYHNEFPLKMKRIVFGFLSKIGKKVTSSTTAKKIFYKIVREHDYENANPVVQKTMRNLITVDLLPVLRALTIPTLIIWGRQDKATPVEDGLMMHKEIKNSQLFIIDDARHSPQFTHPDEVAKKVISNIS